MASALCLAYALAACEATPASPPPTAAAPDRPGTATARPPASPAGASTAAIAGTLYYLSGTGYPAGVHRLTAAGWVDVVPGMDDTDDLAIAADGRRIAWIDGATSRLLVSNVDGTGRRAVDASASRPQWSPDGTRIAYEHRAGRASSVWVRRADGSHPVELARAGSYPTWSADGGWIVFISASSSAGPDRLTAIRPDGTGRRSVALASGSLRLHSIGSVSPGARTILAYVTCRTCSAGDPTRYYGNSLIDLTTGRNSAMASSQGRPVFQLWTADGRTLVRVMTGPATAVNSPSFALELHGRDGVLLVRQPEPAQAELADLAVYTP